MICIEDVFIWFKQLKNSIRIDLICGLLNLCTPHELRYFGTVLEDLGKKDFHYLWENEQKANTESELVKLTNINDPSVRSQLIISMVLLRSANFSGAAKIFNILVEELPMEKLALPGMLAEEKCLNEVILLVTLAARHPAFSFEQKVLLSQRLVMLDKVSCPSSTEFPAQEDIELYNNSNMLWSSFTPVPASNLPESTDLEIVPVLSMYPALSTAVTAVTTTYITSWPQPLPNSTVLNVEDSSRVQVTSLEFCGVEKHRSYRIRALWSNGKQIEVLRSYHEISAFHQKLLQSFSQGAQVSNSETIIPPFQSSCNGHNLGSLNNSQDELADNKIQLTEYFRKLTSMLHVLDQDLIASFLQSSPKAASLPLSSQYIEESGSLRSPSNNPNPLIYNPGHTSPQYQASTQLADMSGNISNLSSGLLSSDTRPSVFSSLSPTASPLSSPISSPLVSPPASETSSRSASPWQQQISTTHQPNSSIHPPTSIRALHLKGSNCNKNGSNVGSGDATHQGLHSVNSKLQNMSIEDLERLGLAKGAAGKLKKNIDIYGNNPPNGATNFHQYSKNNNHNNPGNASHGILHSTSGQSVYSNSTNRPRSESSPSCSDYSSPPPSPPLSEGSNGQGIQMRSQTSSSSEENLNDQGFTIKTDQGLMQQAPPLSTYNHVSTSCGNGLIPTPSKPLTNPLESHVPIVTTTPLLVHPFKPNMLSLHCRSSTGSPHFAGHNQIPFDSRLLSMSPALHVIANSSVPPPGIPRPAHLSPQGMPSPSERANQMTIPGMLSYGPAMTSALPCTAAPSSRSLTVHRNNQCSSGTTVTSIHNGNNGSHHRYTPPKVHHHNQSPLDKNSPIILPSQPHPHPLSDFLTPMLFTQPPPPVASSTTGGGPTSPYISSCLSNCNCTTSVSSSLGPMVSPAPQGPPTNNVGAPATLPYTVGFLPHVFHQHPLQFMASHSGASPTSYISPGMPTHFAAYTLPNGMSHNLGHEIIYTSHGFPLTAPTVVTTVPGGCSNASGAVPTVQQGTLPLASMVAPSGVGTHSAQFLAFPGKCPFPPLGTIAPPKIPSCHNCGGQGHKGQDCKDHSSSDEIQKTTNQFRINYNSTTKQPVDSHD